jgi:hypothetical protein
MLVFIPLACLLVVSVRPSYLNSVRIGFFFISFSGDRFYLSEALVSIFCII